MAAGPGELVDRLTRWAAETEWVEWLELGGSLGRGAGDEWSDIDAGVGVTREDVIADVQAVVSGFAPVAATLRQAFGPTTTHLIVAYADGRQLSLVISPAQARSGLPPQALALVDKAGRLATPLERTRWDPDHDQRREWTFLACIEAGDALKHASRDHLWRALRSLNEARDHYLQLLAAEAELIFPQFGAVSLENADSPLPDELTGTLVGTADPAAIAAAVRTLVGLLKPYIIEHDLDRLVVALRPSLLDVR